MSKPNLKKQQKRSERKEKIKQQQHQASLRENNEFKLMCVQTCLNEKKFEAAISYCRSILNNAPDHLQALDMYATALMHLQRYEDALSVNEKLTRLSPDTVFHYYNCIVCMYNLQQFKEILDFTAQLPKGLKIPKDIKDRIKSAIDICKIRVAETSVKKYIPGNTSSCAISEKISNSTEPIKDLQKIEIAPSALKVDSLKFDFLKQGNDTDPHGLFWLGFLLNKEHEKMQSEFEELLCVSHTCGVTHFGYQAETVRKVLKIFHGRVLLSDEVGLGKTIEAAMVLKEYLLRGMVKTVLILCPPSLVEQWTSELLKKFSIKAFHQSGTITAKKSDTFWDHNVVIASLHTAKNATNFKKVTAKPWDMVIVDEAHHLKNRRTLGWKLVNSIQKKFCLLLSATPVQNDLVELYNLITLLKPGTFPLEKEFLATYCEAKNKRKPKNAHDLRMLLRDVMIRNTRAGCGVRFPKRFASTSRIEFTSEEADIYTAITDIAHQCTQLDSPLLRLSVRLVLERAGAHLPLANSSLRSLSTLLRSGKVSDNRELCEAIAGKADACLDKITHLPDKTAKIQKLVTILKDGKRPTLVFCRHTAEVVSICNALVSEDIPHAVFHGSVSVQERSEALERFRSGQVQVLVSSESGGEGHNLQFCNSLVNFDLPWNPMQIEQRIGRIHRIGQDNDVFVFNLCYSDTIEEHILEILETKIRMFELVIGEVDSILGNLDEQGGFSEVVFDLWAGNKDQKSRSDAFVQLGDQLVSSRNQYLETCALDEELFGTEIEA
ncbi:MAG TPA: SNF2-related protein [Chitinispirillaceae bacterium]|nr:SNF2-related protein [Chitinispirillaceae bacterium]